MLLTGRLDGDNQNGRVTYLAGHDYSVSLPITSNPQTNGVRLMLDSLFESDCATTMAQPDVVLTKSAPALISSAAMNPNQINYTIALSNPGPRPVENLKLTDVLPAGVTYINGSGVPAPTSVAGGIVTWNLAPLGSGLSTNVIFAVSVTADGTYLNDAELEFSHLTVRTVVSNTTSTVRDTGAPDVSITAGPTGTTNDSTPTFEFVNNDNTATVMECKIDGSFVACSEAPASFTPMPLSSGPYTFTVRVADAAGNQSTANRPFTVDLDRRPSRSSVPIRSTRSSSARRSISRPPTAVAVSSPPGARRRGVHSYHAPRPGRCRYPICPTATTWSRSSRPTMPAMSVRSRHTPSWSTPCRHWWTCHRPTRV